MIAVLLVSVFALISVQSVDFDYDWVREEEEANFEWYVENKEWIRKDYPNPQCILIRNKEILMGSEYFHSCMDRLETKHGDICICVDDEARTSADEEVLVLVPSRRTQHTQHTQVLQSVNADPPYDVDLASYVAFKSDYSNQLYLTTYDRDPRLAQDCLHRRLHLYAVIQKDSDKFHGLNVSFVFDSGAKQTYVTPTIYHKMTKLNFQELMYPKRLEGYIGSYPVHIEQSSDHFEEFNIFGTDVSRFFRVEYCMYCNEYKVEPLKQVFYDRNEMIRDCSLTDELCGRDSSHQAEQTQQTEIGDSCNDDTCQ